MLQAESVCVSAVLELTGTCSLVFIDRLSTSGSCGCFGCCPSALWLARDVVNKNVTFQYQQLSGMFRAEMMRLLSHLSSSNAKYSLDF